MYWIERRWKAYQTLDIVGGLAITILVAIPTLYVMLGFGGMLYALLFGHYPWGYKAIFPESP